MEYIELYRAIIPENKIINDNNGQHYRIKMGKLDWLTNQFNRILNEETDEGANFSFKSIDLESLKKKVENPFSIRCEIWRCCNRRFDCQNYCTTFKAPIDLLVHNGYIPDDSWKFINSIEYSGGGYDAWSRAVRYENDGLTENFLEELFVQKRMSQNDILIRILVK